ncbi:hypothetical protein ACFRFE_47245, partial [Streptomyces sp. NPDC056683]
APKRSPGPSTSRCGCDLSARWLWQELRLICRMFISPDLGEGSGRPPGHLWPLLPAAAQGAHLDDWASTHPTQRTRLIPFVRWAHARRIVRDLEIHHRPSQLPGTFQDETTRQAELRRCLTDTSLPLPMRSIGALVRLYAPR